TNRNGGECVSAAANDGPARATAHGNAPGAIGVARTWAVLFTLDGIRNELTRARRAHFFFTPWLHAGVTGDYPPEEGSWQQRTPTAARKSAGRGESFHAAVRLEPWGPNRSAGPGRALDQEPVEVAP